MKFFDPENMFPGFAFDPVTAIGGAVSIGSSLLGKKSSKSAASAQSAGDAAAIQEQRRQFDLIRESEAPFIGAGTNSVNQLQWLLGLGPQTQPVDANNPDLARMKTAINPIYASTVPGSAGKDIYYNSATGQASLSAGDGYQKLTGINTASSYDPAAFDAQVSQAYQGLSGTTPATSTDYAGGSYGSLSKPFTTADFNVDPGYQFALDQGTKALQRTQAANGQLQSGAAAKAINDYTQGVANQQYGAAYDRYNTNQTNLYNKLMGLTNVGQSAASNQASAGQNMANQVGNYMENQGNANANGILGQNTSWQTGLSGLGNIAQQAFSPGINVGTQSGFNYGPITWN